MKRSFSLVSLITLAASLQAQPLQWNAYDTDGSLLGAAGTGGNAGTSVNLSVPAGTTRIFVTRNFNPLGVGASGSIAQVNLSLSASTGLTDGPTYTLGLGLFNSGGSTTVADDAGLFGLWDPQGPYPEVFSRTVGNNLFAGDQLGQGGFYSGGMTNGIVYDAVIRVVNTDGGIYMGTGPELENAGIGFTGPGTAQRVYSGPLTDQPMLYDLFALMFHNASPEEAIITLENIELVPEPTIFAITGLCVLGALLQRRKRH